MSDDMPAVKRGRPRKPVDELRSEVLRIRATPDETDELYRAARKAGFQTLGDYLRARLGLAAA